MNRVVKELVLLLSLFLIAATLQYFAESLPMVLCFYFLPTLYSAYHFGRRHATLTAFACVFVVVLLNFVNSIMPAHATLVLPGERLFNFAIWAGMLAVTSYVMGTLYERKQAMTNDIRESFSGLLVVLQHFLENERYAQGDNKRVLDMVTSMANVMGMGSDRIEVLRSAIMLRSLSVLGISHDMLYKAADVSRNEIVASFRKNRRSDPRAQAMGGALRRVIPIIVAEQILEEQGARAVNVPIEAHILAVADMFLRLTSGADGKAMTADEAEGMIAAASGEKFQAGVVDAFVKVCNQGAQAFGASAGV
ncbi:MAG TPA: hypothetical protein VNW47_00450 [Terriglobales bacterium]|jgi:hypothetical protein|nr:hypothetical protein [Terriglobales bacterium]